MNLNAPILRLFYLNALFDLELGGHPIASVAAGAKEMTALFCFLGQADDRVLLEAEVRDDHWEYLSRCGIEVCRPLGPKENADGFSAVPWGWNDPCVKRLAALGARCRFPDLSVVKQVNSRAWCAAFNRESGTGVPGSRFCASMEEVREALGDSFPLVAKPNFGGSGFGFVRIDGADELSGPKKSRLNRLIGSGGLTLEPWCDRICDLSSSCAIGENGSIGDLRHYRCHTTSHGAFYAVSIGGADPFLDCYRFDLERAALLAAGAIARTGYFGPLGFDSFVYREPRSGEKRLAPVIEINARYVMSAVAHALHSKIGSGRPCLFRFITRRRCSLPDTYHALDTLLGEDRYDPRRGTGVVALSPLRVNHGTNLTQPARSAFFIVGSSEEETFAMDRRLGVAVGRRENSGGRS